MSFFGQEGIIRQVAEAVSRQVALRGGNKIAILGNSITFNGAGPRDPDGSTGWTASTAVSLNAYNKPVAYDLSNGYAPLKYKATTAGTTGATEPIWPQAAGGTVTDGTVVWTAEYLSGVPAWPSGWWTFAQALSGQRLDEVFIAGASGKQSDVVLSYLDRALATNPDIVFFANLPENDLWPGSPPVLSTIIARWAAAAAAYDRVRGMGKRIIIQTAVPSANIDSSSGFTGYSRGNGTKAWEWFNKKIREYARAHGDVILFEPDRIYIDPNPTNPVYPENTSTFLAASGSGQSLKLTDGIHPYVSGNWKIGVALAAVLAANFPLVDRFGIAGELNQRHPNPLNYGTGGTNGTNASGSVANLMTATAFSASGTVTGVNSKVARTDIAGSWQRMVYDASAGAADNASYNNTSNIVMTPLAIGDVIQLFGEIRIVANPTLLTFPNVQLRMLSGTPQWCYALNAASTDQDIGQMITADTTLTLKTLPMAISPSTTALQTIGRVTGRAAAVFTADFGRFAVGKTIAADPA